MRCLGMENSPFCLHGSSETLRQGAYEILVGVPPPSDETRAQLEEVTRLANWAPRLDEALHRSGALKSDERERNEEYLDERRQRIKDIADFLIEKLQKLQTLV